ncbi:hypothetical protein F5887DRAFT_48191 [Amanita rubescens]|nr:hypothetical protein F5887DRAFT_48191 [Amanita rubescens]
MPVAPSTSALQAPNAAGLSRPDVSTHQINLLSWVPYSTRTILADYLLRGHPYCIRYAISSWPESVLPVDHWEYFEFLPATTPCLSTVVLRLPSLPKCSHSRAQLCGFRQLFQCKLRVVILNAWDFREMYSYPCLPYFLFIELCVTQSKLSRAPSRLRRASQTWLAFTVSSTRRFNL